MFPFIESIRVFDGRLCHISWHQKRMEYTLSQYYKHSQHFDLQQIIKIPDSFSKGLVKLRFLYNNTDYYYEFAHYTPKNISSFELIEANTIDYSLKHTNRNCLNTLKKKSKADEIMIVKNNMITDTSFSNIVFFNGKDWITPKYPLLKGTARARLIDEGKIQEVVITTEQLHQFTYFKLINALLDWEDSPIYYLHQIRNYSE